MKSQHIFIATLLFLFITTTHHLTTAVAPACTVVTGKASNCLTYAMGKATTAKPPQACCDGLTYLTKLVSNVDDKKAICRCLKNSAKNIKGIQDKFLSNIPKACGIQLSFPVSTSVNCETIS